MSQFSTNFNLNLPGLEGQLNFLGRGVSLSIKGPHNSNRSNLALTLMAKIAMDKGVVSRSGKPMQVLYIGADIDTVGLANTLGIYAGDTKGTYPAGFWKSSGNMGFRFIGYNSSRWTFDTIHEHLDKARETNEVVALFVDDTGVSPLLDPNEPVKEVIYHRQAKLMKLKKRCHDQDIALIWIRNIDKKLTKPLRDGSLLDTRELYGVDFFLDKHIVTSLIPGADGRMLQLDVVDQDCRHTTKTYPFKDGIPDFSLVG